MKLVLKRVSVIICILSFMFVFTAFQAAAADKAVQQSAEVKVQPHHLVVTYFHGTFRCPTCHKIENLSAKAIKTHFKDELQSGKLIFRVINVEEPGNEHYMKDYQLYTKSLIVSDVKNGKERRWKNLEKIWVYVRDDQKFDNYVKSEIADWLKE